MNHKTKLLIKSTTWECLSFLLGFSVMYLITGELGSTTKVSLILLVSKSILLAVYDHYADKVINR